MERTEYKSPHKRPTGNLKKFLNRKWLADFVIHIGKRKFYIDKTIFTSTFDYFAFLLDYPDESINYQVEPSLCDNPEVFEALIGFAYTGKITLTGENIVDVYGTSLLMNIGELCQECERLLCEAIDNDSIVGTLILTEKHNWTNILLACGHFLTGNESAVLETTEFLYLSHSQFQLFITALLKLFPKTEIFKVIAKWIKFSFVVRKDYIEELLCLSPLEELPYEFLKDRVGEDKRLMALPVYERLYQDAFAKAHARRAAQRAAELAQLEAKKAAELEAKKAAELEAKKAVELAARRAAELEAKKAAELAVKTAAELEAKKAAELEAKKAAELASLKAAELAKQAAQLAAQKAAELKAKKAAEKSRGFQFDLNDKNEPNNYERTPKPVKQKEKIPRGFDL